jgi:electron transport complex protein RnfG
MVEPAAQSNTPRRAQSRLAGAICLVLFALAAAWLLSSIQQTTRQRIADNELAERLKGLQALLPEGRFDNEPHKDFILVTSADLLGSEKPLPIFRARLGQQTVAAILTAVAPNGFAGKIRILVSVDMQGEIIGVRAISHNETPGLGDRIEAKKSDWIMGFAGLATADPTTSDWKLERDGGNFDQLTGATVSSRAVLNAARNAVLYFNANSAEILSAPSEWLSEADR